MNISGNETLDEQLPQVVYESWEIALLICLLTLGLLGNVMLLIAQWKDPLRCFGTTCTYLIQHMAIADTFTLHVYYCILFTSVKGSTFFYVGSKHIKYFKPFIVFITVLTNLCVTSMAVERFMSVAKPFSHKIYFTKRRVRFSFAIVWIFGLVCVGIDQGINRLAPEIPFSTFAVESFIFLPCLVITFSLYFAAFVSIKRQQRRFKQAHMAEVARDAFKIKLSNERKFLVTMTVMSAVTAVLWAPVFLLLPPLQMQKILSIEFYHLFVTVIPCLAALHASIKPIVYILRMPKYRRTFYVLYCCLCAQ